MMGLFERERRVTRRASFSDIQRVMSFVRKASADEAKFSFARSMAVVDAFEGICLNNYDVEARYRMGDGLLLFYKGVSRALLLQAKGHIRLLVWDREDSFTRRLTNFLNKVPEEFLPIHHEHYFQWRIFPAGSEEFLNFWRRLPKSTRPDSLPEGGKNHPRYISVDVRRLAWSSFERDGFVCPGFARERHKVDIQGGERIEYDHILPAAKGGSNNEINVQVMCAACNRRKSDSI